MKEIVVISGKGGTGKTSISASFAILGGKDVIVADCDVDAADMHLLMQPDFGHPQDFYSGEIAEINQDKCTGCGECADICRFNAIQLKEDTYVVDPMECEGCGYCARVCPTDAITNISQNVGEWYVSHIKSGSIMVHARLGIGADNTGKLVAKVKNKARQIAKESKSDYVIVDGSPGIGCPVVSSLAGAAFAVLVTEPSVSGLHDLKRVYQLVKKFGIKAGCIVNKADINPKIAGDIDEFLIREKIIPLATLPYDERFTRAMTLGKTIIEYEENELSPILSDSWEKIKQSVKNSKESK